MATFLWEMCLDQGIQFGCDLVFLCCLGPHGLTVWHLLCERYQRLDWDDPDQNQRPEAFVEQAFQQHPEARLFLIHCATHPSTGEPNFSLERDVLDRILSERTDERHALLRSGVRLGVINNRHLSVAQGQAGALLLDAVYRSRLH